MKRSTDKQTEDLLNALKKGPLTALQILEQLGIARASARVFDLRHDGWDVRSQMIVVKNRRGDDCRVALYTLASTQRSFVPVLEASVRRAA
jgi:hypothetical protein